MTQHLSPAKPQPRAITGLIGLALMTGSIAAPWLDPAVAGAHSKGMYKTRQEAERRAAQLKCKRVFAMGDAWMPRANEQALHKALQNE
ncbi:DUF3721 domain-containing protein [Synechococcus sp. RedBA-s]|nr:DUF3721 domain-containing protein [Synechococcus sp. RedBA-s]